MRSELALFRQDMFEQILDKIMPVFMRNFNPAGVFADKRSCFSDVIAENCDTYAILTNTEFNNENYEFLNTLLASIISCAVSAELTFVKKFDKLVDRGGNVKQSNIKPFEEALMGSVTWYLNYAYLIIHVKNLIPLVLDSEEDLIEYISRVFKQHDLHSRWITPELFYDYLSKCILKCRAYELTNSTTLGQLLSGEVVEHKEVNINGLLGNIQESQKGGIND